MGDTSTPDRFICLHSINTGTSRTADLLMDAHECTKTIVHAKPLFSPTRHASFSSQLKAWQAAGVCLGQAIESKNGVNSVENAKSNKETHFPIKHCNKPHNSKLRSFGQCSCRLVFLGPWTLMTLATNSADCSLSIQHLVSWIPCRYQGWLCRALKINLHLTGNTHHYCNQQICTRRTISIINRSKALQSFANCQPLKTPCRCPLKQLSNV